MPDKNIINSIRAQRLSWLGRSHRKDARYENCKGNILLETHLKKVNRKTKDSLGTKTELAQSHRKNARYENGKGNMLLETHLKKVNRKTKDSMGG
jgi:hypothetical protein